MRRRDYLEYANNGAADRADKRFARFLGRAMITEICTRTDDSEKERGNSHRLETVLDSGGYRHLLSCKQRLQERIQFALLEYTTVRYTSKAACLGITDNNIFRYNGKRLHIM